MKTKAKRLATLKPAENKAWIDAFNQYLGTGYSSHGADRNAWREIQEQFPRLKKYDGCKP